MEAEFAFEPFGKLLTADSVDLERAFTRRLDHIIDPAGKGAKQPAPCTFREMRGCLDSAIACLGEFNFGTAGVAGVRILGNMNADNAFFARMDFHRSADVAQVKPCRGWNREVFSIISDMIKLLFSGSWIAFRPDYRTLRFFLPIGWLTSRYCFPCKCDIRRRRNDLIDEIITYCLHNFLTLA